MPALNVENANFVFVVDFYRTETFVLVLFKSISNTKEIYFPSVGLLWSLAVGGGSWWWDLVVSGVGC